MNVAIDTNAYIDFIRGEPSKVQTFRTATNLYMPLIVLGELRAGFAMGTQQSINSVNLHRFLNRPRVSVLLADEQTTHHYAHIYSELRKQGITIPTNDMWIAALAIQHNLILCTSDAHFRHIPQLPRC